MVDAVTRPTALVVQHLAVEGPGAIGDSLRAAGVAVSVVRTDLGEPLPTDLGGVDGLVVMGGPMSARHDERFPTRMTELELLRAALDAGLPTLGICLGAQLLAAAAGGEVIEGHGPEIGWGRVTLTDSAADDPLFTGLPGELSVLHWHGETYDLPPGAVHLARSEAYDQQAFRVGKRAWGLQFHVEVDRDQVAAFVEAFPDDAAAAPGGAAAVAAATEPAVAALATHRDLLLSRFAELVAA